MKPLVIPSIFKAVDKFSGPVQKMAKKSDAAFARMERNMRKVSKTAANISKKSFLIGAAIVAPMVIFANEAVGFEEKMSNVATLIDTSVESIEDMGDKVLDLSKKLPVPIEELTSSLYDVRSAGIAADKQFEVLEASAMLSVAGLSSVEEATNLTTSAMNAFAKEGKSANEINNILFKTVKFGKTTVAELSQAFGSVAPIIESSGTSLADFSAATAALTTLGTPASQAQNQLKASIVALQKPSAEMQKVFGKLGVTTDKELIQKFGGLVGGFDAVNGAIEEMGLNAGKTWRSTEALGAVTSLTGATNEAYLTTLEAMSNGVDDLGVAYDKQSKTGKAQMQIAKNNMQALAITLGQTLIPMITSLVEAVSPIITKFSDWAKNNKKTVATIMKVAAVAAGLAFTISAVAGVVSLASKGFAIYSGIIKAWQFATKAAAAVQVIWNMAMAANPIGLMVVAVGLAIVAVYALTKAFSSQTAAQKVNNEVHTRALENTIDQRTEVMVLFKTLRLAEEGSTAYNNTLKELDRIQPGIIDKYNLQTKALNNINLAEKELTASIMKRAMAEAQAEIMKEKIKTALVAKQEGPGFMDKFIASSKNAALSIFTGGASDVSNLFGATPFNTAEQSNQNFIDENLAQADILANQQATNEIEAVNPKKTDQEVQKEINETTTKEQVKVIFENLPAGATVEGNGSNFAMPSVTQTN